MGAVVRVRMDGRIVTAEGELLPLTRRALATWPRWRDEATSERAEQTITRWANLDPLDVRVLQQLRANREDAGDPATWFCGASVGLFVTPETIETLFHGIAVRREHVHALARDGALDTFGRLVAFRRGLIEYVEKLEEKMGEQEQAEIQTPESVVTTEAAPDAPIDAPRYVNKTDRLAALIAERGLDATNVPGAVRKELAEILETTPATIGAFLSALRRSGKPARPKPPARTGPNGRAPAAPPELPAPTAPARFATPELPASPPLRRLVAIVLQRGIDSVSPPELRDPLRRLIDEAIGLDEQVKFR